jgi:YidC/Oxa1 family membrane protein insertase
MHDTGVRIVSALVAGGVLLLVASYVLSLLLARRPAAAAAHLTPAGIEHPTDYAWLAPVARPIEWTLRQVEARVTRTTGRSRWGWAIVLTTCALNLLLFPFRLLGTRNAQRLRALQPEIDAIRARRPAAPHEDEEIADVYRRHRINPLAGCLPSLLPYALLAAFYSVLTQLGDLHGAAWLWIADLSRPEQLPLRILPLASIATQLVLARATPLPAGADPRTRWTMALMPLAFGVLLYNRPAALMLYWTTSNLLQLFQQWWLARRFPASGVAS